MFDRLDGKGAIIAILGCGNIRPNLRCRHNETLALIPSNTASHTRIARSRNCDRAVA